MNFEVYEGDLREVTTEDGVSYFPDLGVLATDGHNTFISPVWFYASTTAQYEAEDYRIAAEKAFLQNGTLPKDWVKPTSREGYQEVEPFDEEELYFN